MTDTKTTETTSAPEAKVEAKVSPRLLGKPYFQRKKSCPFTGPRAPKIDYKDARNLARFVSDFGKILPCHITGVSHPKQRVLANAIKRARHLALLSYSDR